MFNPRGNKKECDKPVTTKNREEEKKDQVLNLIKNLNPLLNHENKPNTSEESQLRINYNRQTRL